MADWGPTSPQPGGCVVVTSLGQARASDVRDLARAMAQDTAQSVGAVEQAIWQAPTMVLQGLAPLAARRWVKRLTQAGLEVASEVPFVPDQRAPLHDAAICPRSPAAHQRLGQELAQFFGVERAEALRRLNRDQGWVLARISTASILALRDRFTATDVSVRVSDPAATPKDLDTRRMSRSAQAALDRALAMIGLRRTAMLPAYLARALGESFAPRGLRLVDRAFRNHLVRLTAPPRSEAAQAAAIALSGQTGIDIQAASRCGPVVLDRGLDWYEAPEAAAAYRAAGLQVDVAAEPLGELDPAGDAVDPIPPSGGAFAFEGQLQQIDEGPQAVGQGARAGIDDADLDRLAAPLRQQADQATTGKVIAYDIFRQKR